MPSIAFASPRRDAAPRARWQFVDQRDERINGADEVQILAVKAQADMRSAQSDRPPRRQSRVLSSSVAPPHLSLARPDSRRLYDTISI